MQNVRRRIRALEKLRPKPDAVHDPLVMQVLDRLTDEHLKFLVDAWQAAEQGYKLTEDQRAAMQAHDSELAAERLKSERTS